MNGRQLQNACFAWASRILEGRVAGRRIVAPDWLEPQAICWIAMAPDRPELRVGLRPGIPARALPARLALGGGLFLTIRPMPGQSARAQVAPRMVRATPPIEQGTATCLVRDRLNPDRNYLVTQDTCSLPLTAHDGTTASKSAYPPQVEHCSNCRGDCVNGCRREVLSRLPISMPDSPKSSPWLCSTCVKLRPTGFRSA